MRRGDLSLNRFVTGSEIQSHAAILWDIPCDILWDILWDTMWDIVSNILGQFPIHISGPIEVYFLFWTFQIEVEFRYKASLVHIVILVISMRRGWVWPLSQSKSISFIIRRQIKNLVFFLVMILKIL